MRGKIMKVQITVLVCLLFFLAACKNELVIPSVYHQRVFLDTVLVEPAKNDLQL
jgi:hypothetical protein